MGSYGLVIGAGFLVVAVVVAGVIDTIVAFAIAVPMFAVGMYRFAYRPSLLRAVEAAVPTSAVAHASTRAIWLRVSLMQLPLGAALGLLVLAFGTPEGVAAIWIGNAAALLLTAHWLNELQTERNVTILREPHWRLGPRSSKSRLGRRRATDTQGFYVVPSGTRSA